MRKTLFVAMLIAASLMAGCSGLTVKATYTYPAPDVK